MTMMQEFKKKTSSKRTYIYLFYLYIILPIIAIVGIVGLVKMMCGVTAFRADSFLILLISTLLSILSFATGFMLDKFSFCIQMVLPWAAFMLLAWYAIQFFNGMTDGGSRNDGLTYAVTWWVMSFFIVAIGFVVAFIVYLALIRDVFGFGSSNKTTEKSE